MQILVNGKSYYANEKICVKDIVRELGYEAQAVAVVINGSHVPKSSWPERELLEGQCLELVSPMQGG